MVDDAADGDAADDGDAAVGGTAVGNAADGDAADSDAAVGATVGGDGDRVVGAAVGGGSVGDGGGDQVKYTAYKLTDPPKKAVTSTETTPM